MAVSGLEQRNAPLVLVSKVWSPWGPYMTEPCTQEDHLDGISEDTIKMVHRAPKKLQKCRSWAGYSSYSDQVAFGHCSSQGYSEDFHDEARNTDPYSGSLYADEHCENVDSDSQCYRSGLWTPPETSGTPLRSTTCDSTSDVLSPRSEVAETQPGQFPLTELYLDAQTRYLPGLAPQIGYHAQDKPQKNAKVMSERRRRPRRKKSDPPSTCMTVPDKSDVPHAEYDMEMECANVAFDTQSMGLITTLVIRNLPRTLTQQELVQAMEGTGYAETWDFIYLPYKFQARRNFGFAFVNFITAEMAQSFVEGWHQSRPFSFGRVRKPVNVAAAAVQGREANEQKARWLMNQVKNPAYQPVLMDYCDGARN